MWRDEIRKYPMIVKVALALGAISFVISVLDLSLMFLVNIPENVDPVEIYARVLSSAFAILVMGFFFDRFYRLHFLGDRILMKPLKVISIILAAAAVVKVLISAYYLYFCILNGNIVLLYYAGEILLWSVMAIFAWLYYRRMSKSLKNAKQ